jgi:hypothetical protein
MKVNRIKRAELDLWEEDCGFLTGVFTADEGDYEGDNWYVFKNAKMTEYYPGTRSIKSVVEGDIARVRIENGEWTDSSWRDNIRIQQYGLPHADKEVSEVQEGAAEKTGDK